ncbi:MAG TPA: hypothetical protein VIU63_04800, partial [Nitrospira sp.]
SVLASSIPHSGTGISPVDYFRWAKELAEVRPRIAGIEHWEQIEHQMIAPHVNQVLQAIPRLVTGEAAKQWEDWRDRYIPQLLKLLGGMRREATEKSRLRVGRVIDAINPLFPQDKRKEPLSRKALWVLRSTPGVTCVLNGMRSKAYVDDSLVVLQWKGLGEVRTIYEKAREAAS